jgi:hypothetical protein
MFRSYREHFVFLIQLGIYNFEVFKHFMDLFFSLNLLRFIFFFHNLCRYRLDFKSQNIYFA